GAIARPPDKNRQLTLRFVASTTMAFDDSFEDEFFANRIKTMDDILDSPILTTIRRDIYHYVSSMAPLARLAIRGCSQGGTFDREVVKREVLRRFFNNKVPRSLSHLVHSALELVLKEDLTKAPISLLDCDQRYEILSDLRLYNESFVEDMNNNLVRAKSIYDRAREGIRTQLQSKLTPLADPGLYDQRALPFYYQYAHADAILEKIIHSRQTQGLDNLSGSVKVRYSRGNALVEIITSGDIVVFRTAASNLITSWDDFLGIRAMSIYRRNCFLLLALDSTLPRQLLESFPAMLDWQEKCILLYGNRGFELMKATESIFKSRLMQINDGPEVGDAFSLMVMKQREKEKKLIRLRQTTSSSATPLVDALERLARSVKDSREAAELFGAFKYSGHPYIDPSLASQSSREHGTSPGKASFIETMKMRAEYCDMILRGYIIKHGRWPSMIFGTRPTTLESLFLKKITNFSTSDYPFTDWYDARFPKFQEFDYNVDFLDLMDDKSAGLDPQDAWKAWDSLKRENYKDSFIPDTRSKKLMIRILSMEKFDPEAICNEIRKMDLDTAELSMALYPKEREFKLEARLFVMLEFSVRVFLTLAEKNFKRLMKDYLPEQSMTKGRKGTMQYLESLSVGRRDETVDTCFIEIDLTRWNLLWRGDVVNPVSRVNDQIFGLPGAFSRGHKIFEKSTVVVRVPSETPKGVTAGSTPSQWPEGDFVWRNHVGGFEGIIQGQWTACTQAMIRLIMSTFDIISYRLLGQGDNQVLAVTYRRDDKIPKMRQALDVSSAITKELERRFGRINQIVKPEECLVSLTTVTYSKICFVNGVQIPTTLKHAATVAPVGTATIPALAQGLSAISSGARATADSFTDPSRAYLYFLILFRDYLARARKTLPSADVMRDLDWSDPMIDLACVIPSDLGGLPIQIPTDFLFGGCSDRLSASIAAMVSMAHTDPRVERYLGYLDSDLPWKEKPDPASLLEDPFGAPIRPAPGADVKIDTAIKAVVPSITKNLYVRQIMSVSSDSFETDLKKFLVSQRPFYPLLMADLVELSVSGVKRKIFTKFTGTRTIQQILRRRAPINYHREIVKSDHRRILRCFSMIQESEEKKLRSKFSTPVIFQRAESYRARWFPGEKEVLQGVTTIHPFEARTDPGLVHDTKDYLEFVTKCDWKTMMNQAGPHAGRWGDKTWEHRKVTGVEVIGRQKATLAAKRLLLMESQLAAGREMKACIRTILKQRTDVDGDTLEKQTSKIAGGVGAHRWDSTIEEKAFAWLGAISPTQHCSVQSDTMTTLSGGVKDYSFCFQEHIFFGMQLLRSNPEVFDKFLTLRLHYSIGEEHEIVNTPIEGNGWKTRQPPPNLSGNPLVCAGSILYQTLSEELPLQIAPLKTLPEECSEEMAERLMVHSFLDQIEHPVLSEALRDNKEAPSGLSIDVGSLVGAGLKALINAAGTACFMRAIEMVYSETIHMDRILFNVYVDRLSSVCAMPLARFANTPSVRKQHWVRSTGILIAPGRFGGRALQSRIAARIREIAAERLRDVFKFDKYKIVLSSYAERATPSKILGCYVAIALFQLNPSSMEEGRRLYRRHLNNLRRLEVERERVAEHIRILHDLSNDEFDDTAFFVKEILSGRVIRRTSIGLDDTKRFLRSGKVHETTRTALVRLPPVPHLEIGGVTTGTVREFDLSLPRLPQNRFLDAVRLIIRNTSWVAGSSSISRDSLRVFSLARKLIKQGPCIQVGVGNGAMARDLFAIGATHVVGVDLVSDLPQLSSLGSAYVPPELPTLERGQKWAWAASVFTDGGNWYDPRVSAQVLSLQPSVICVDIQPGVRPIWDDILPILASRQKLTVIFRRELTAAELSKFLSGCTATFRSTKVVRTSYNPNEYYFVCRTSGVSSPRFDDSPLTEPIPSLDPGFNLTNSYYYPSSFNQVRSSLWRGRSIPESKPAESIDYLLNYFRGQKPRDFKEITEDIALAAYSASELSRFNSLHLNDPELLIGMLAELAITPSPEFLHGVKIPSLRRSSLFTQFARIAPKLLSYTRDGWQFAL
ncbi:RNA-dependent RNA polymerase, partial [Soybean leaf-associated negative-stranded RNA virus 3]